MKELETPSQEFMEGVFAFHLGKSVRNCPYIHNDEEPIRKGVKISQWKTGYHMAMYMNWINENKSSGFLDALKDD